ncbi:exonuclease domain-containing protein [Melioribacteraceae bacterium 4301-Me]|uniref:exonuclease domain-containing protein n=1 Tax=Pyranulibacter aquaticus TaxID=3163344 RepID=UPI003596967E
MKKEIDISEVPFEDGEYCVFDFETTGTSPFNDRVIEIGIVKIKKGKITDTFQSLINPEMSIPAFITEMTGITNEDLVKAPTFEKIFPEIEKFFGSSVLVAHNFQFDYSFLKSECKNLYLNPPQNPSICTVQLARRLYPELKSKSLGILVRHLKIRHRNVHRGLGDSMATAKIFIKMFNLLRNEHNIETISDLINFQKTPGSALVYRIIKKKLADDLSSLPSSPGVYFFKDKREKIIYIGKAKSLKQRVSQYFLNNAPKKIKEIVRKAERIGFTPTNSELTALLKEAELIKIHFPHYNTMLKQYSKNYFIKILLTHNAPTAVQTNDFFFDGNDYFGPYSSKQTAKILLEIIDRTFRLRECSDKEFSKKKKCYLADIDRCLAPCVQNIDNDYKNELDLVYEFLAGENQWAVNRLLNRMKELAQKQKYEEAANVRDLVNEILHQIHKTSILAEPINKAKVLFEIRGYNSPDYILLINGKMTIKNEMKLENDDFTISLQDYFNGSIFRSQDLDKNDLEKLKIALNWLIKNKESVRVHYLKDYNSIEQLYAAQIFH